MSTRNTNYHTWTNKEIAKVKEHIKLHMHPTGAIPIESLSRELGIPYHAVRGAVIREMQRRNRVDSV